MGVGLESLLCGPSELWLPRCAVDTSVPISFSVCNRSQHVVRLDTVECVVVSTTEGETTKLLALLEESKEHWPWPWPLPSAEHMPLASVNTETTVAHLIAADIIAEERCIYIQAGRVATLNLLLRFPAELADKPVEGHVSISAQVVGQQVVFPHKLRLRGLPFLSLSTHVSELASSLLV